MLIHKDMLREGQKGLAVRKDSRGLFSVIECTVKTGSHGTRRYGRPVDALKYTTEAGAKRALKRWANALYYKGSKYIKYVNLGTIDDTVFCGEEI